MFKKDIKISKILPVILFTGIFVSTHANTIKELTSKKASDKVESQVSSIVASANNSLHPHSIGVGLGQTFLMGDFGKIGDDKISPDLYYNYVASHSFDFLANFHFSSHELGKQKVSLMGIAFNIKAKLFNFDNFSPFLTGGLGFYSPKLRRNLADEMKDSERKTTFGYNFGAGLDLDLNERVRVGLIALVHNPFDVVQDKQPDVEGAYSKLQLTAFYKF